MAHEDTANGIKSIEVGARLLAALTASRKPLPLRELAKCARMSPSKAHRYLASFSIVGLVEQDLVSREYRLGSFACQMGLAAASRSDPLKDAMLLQTQLAAELNETVVLSIWGAEGPTVLRLEESSRSVVMTMNVGYILPLTGSAAGSIFASHMPLSLVGPLIEAERSESRGPRPEITFYRKSGGPFRADEKCDLAVATGGVMAGITAIAAPLLDGQGNLSAVLAVMSSEHRLDISPNGKPACALLRVSREFRMKHVM